VSTTVLPRTSTEKIKLPSGRTVHVLKCETPFNSWTGRTVPTYGGKAILKLDGKPLYAELVVLRLLEKEGWHCVWVDSYRRRFWARMPHTSKPAVLPKERHALIDRIKNKAGCRGGCLDVFVWRGNQVRFIELKRKGKDSIRETQKKWIEAACRCGIRMSDLLIVEWHPKKRHSGRESHSYPPVSF
jgi:hypothetical protein